MAIFSGHRGFLTTLCFLSIDQVSWNCFHKFHTTLGIIWFNMNSLEIWTIWIASSLGTLFHHLNVGGYSFLQLVFEFNRWMKKRKEICRVHRNFVTRAYKACSSTSSAYLYLCSYMSDIQYLPLCLEAMVLYFIQFFFLILDKICKFF